MITLRKEFQANSEYALTRIGSPESLLFFDIETTGLSAFSSCLYLIGAVTVEDGHFILRQWFSESLSEEQEVLRAFFDFASRFETLISFNGETFDIRYLSDCAKQYGLKSPLPSLQSYDILKHLRKKRSLLPVPNFRQKSIELFLGIGREDRYTGGELIEVYESYVKSHDKEAAHFLLLHNEEDIKGMPKILPALLYSEALNEDFSVQDTGISKDGKRFFASAVFPFSFPKPVDYDFSEDIHLHFEKNRIDFSVRLLYGELKYFYPDYKNYFFLTEEGYAIHRKLAAGVDKAYRVPATPASCYTLMRGFFLPSLKGSGLRLFFDEYRAPSSYHLLEEDPDFTKNYLQHILRLI